jgi:class 3 adenylate cyclase/pimeloyl-ACP methyl ester carboxylesterase
VNVPETRYTRSGDVSIAYQVVGEGPDLLWIPAFAQHLELMWEEPYRRAWLEDLASTYRLITFDKRGTGLSDRVHGAPPLDERMDDLRAVLDAAGSQRATIFAAGDGADLALVFAASYPERAQAVIAWDGSFRGSWAPDYPWAEPRAESLRAIDEIERTWPAGLPRILAQDAPSLTDEERAAFARVLRLSVSPGAAGAYLRMGIDTDIRGILPSVRVPTLIMHQADRPDTEAGRHIASLIPGAQFMAVERPDRIPVIGDRSSVLDPVRRFIEATATTPSQSERVLATVLFTDIVGSTALAAELGDRAWHELLERHHSSVRTELARHRGVEHDTAGDGFFASFDGPARAIACSVAIQQAVMPLGIELRAGLHTGECELLDGKVSGIAVAIGARVASRAAPGEVLVSQTVKDLVAGSNITFAERDTAELKGVPGTWRLYAVTSA